jgi:hypothetical protein
MVQISQAIPRLKHAAAIMSMLLGCVKQTPTGLNISLPCF